jgi:hypothetical protein
MNEAETRAELIDTKRFQELNSRLLHKTFIGELSSPDGATSINDGCSPSSKRLWISSLSTYSPEGATYTTEGCSLSISN